MNKERRTKIYTVVKNLETEIENANIIRGDLTQMQATIRELRSAESRALDGMEEKWSGTSRYESCEEALEKLEDAESNMKSLLNALQKFEDSLHDIIDELNDATFC